LHFFDLKIALPSSVLELGAQEEAFYLPYHQVSDNELPAEGKLVRQYMSREWLSQFHLVVDQELRVFQSCRLEAEVATIVAKLTDN
jgi:hypothetical protein